MYSVYVLKSLKDNDLYFGQTQDVDQRLMEHNKGKVISTRSRRPFSLLGYKEFQTRNEARWIEFEIKNHSDKRKKFLIDLEAFRSAAQKGRRPRGPLARRGVS